TGHVGERDLAEVEVGNTAKVHLISGQTLDGKIRHISRAASPETRTSRVDVHIPNPEGDIPAGMTAEISVITQTVETVALPRSVVTLNDDGELGVRGVDKAGRVHFYAIDLVDDTPEALYLAGIP